MGKAQNSFGSSEAMTGWLLNPILSSKTLDNIIELQTALV
jgi:hypothetical protein